MAFPITTEACCSSRFRRIYLPKPFPAIYTVSGPAEVRKQIALFFYAGAQEFGPVQTGFERQIIDQMDQRARVGDIAVEQPVEVGALMQYSTWPKAEGLKVPERMD
jgi:hypothetical protein